MSSALYQNDAAVRVVARLVRERDEARGALEEFLAKGAVAPPPAAVATNGDGEEVKRTEKRAAPVEEEETPSTKKPRSSTSTTNEKDLSKIPQETLTAMTTTWEILSKNRRIIAKKSKRSKEQIDQQDNILKESLAGEEGKKVNLCKSTANAGVLCVAKIGVSCLLNNSSGGGGDEYVVTGGHDKQAIVYNVTTGQIVATLSGAGGDVIAVSGMVVSDKVMLVGTGSADGDRKSVV